MSEKKKAAARLYAPVAELRENKRGMRRRERREWREKEKERKKEKKRKKKKGIMGKRWEVEESYQINKRKLKAHPIFFFLFSFSLSLLTRSPRGGGVMPYFEDTAFSRAALFKWKREGERERKRERERKGGRKKKKFGRRDN